MRLLSILLVEDNKADALMIKEAIEDEWKIANSVDHVTSAEEALDRLRTPTRYDVILLDLNLPSMDGIEMLTLMRKEFSDRRPSVIILTSSAAETDIVKAYSLCVQGYLTKPIELDAFVDMIKTLGCWLAVIKLPGGGI